MTTTGSPLTDGATVAASDAVSGNDRGQIDVGVLVARSPHGDPEGLRSVASRAASDAAAALGDATAVTWQFHLTEPARLPDAEDRRPAEFLDHATERMVDGPYDVVVVLTDVPLRSRRERFVPGLASEVSRVAVLSTGRLRRAPRGESRRALDSAAVRWNAATLLCHLVGHVLGADHRHADGGVMEPFRFDPDRRSVPDVDEAVGRHIERLAGDVRETDGNARGTLRRLAFYVTSAARNPALLARGLVQSRAPLLPFSLPKLATAALTPTLVIVFSAEAWDVGFHMDDTTAGLFAAASIVAATLYLLFIQNLRFPRGRHRALTEHAALVNVTVFLVVLFAMVGLFALVGTIILVIELVVFPPNLMSNWPSLEDPTIGLADLVRTGAFISTIGVLSGALAGGLESRAIVHHLTLFRDEP